MGLVRAAWQAAAIADRLVRAASDRCDGRVSVGVCRRPNVRTGLRTQTTRMVASPSIPAERRAGERLLRPQASRLTQSESSATRLSSWTIRRSRTIPDDVGIIAVRGPARPVSRATRVPDPGTTHDHVEGSAPDPQYCNSRSTDGRIAPLATRLPRRLRGRRASRPHRRSVNAKALDVRPSPQGSESSSGQAMSAESHRPSAASAWLRNSLIARIQSSRSS
jgi:hypothetical protein